MRPLVLAAAVVIAGCSARGSSPDGAPPSTTCHIDCFGGFACRGGAVYQFEHRPVPIACGDRTTTCRASQVDAGCTRGCREGARGEHADDLCEENVPKVAGDPCIDDEDCSPAAEIDDAFGRTRPTLVCDRGACAVPASERCDAADDDLDGAVDEGCACAPRIVAELAVGGAARAVTFHDGAIALLRADAFPAATVEIVDGDGAVLATHGGLDHARSLASSTTGLAVLRHSTSAFVEEVVVIEPDGSTRAIPLDRVMPEDDTELHVLGAHWLLVAPAGKDVSVRLHDGATGASLGERTLAIETIRAPHVAAVRDGVAIVAGSAAGTQVHVLDGALAEQVLAVPPRTSGPVGGMDSVGSRLTIGVAGTATSLLTYDLDTARWSDRAVGFLGQPRVPLVLVHGEEAIASWVDEEPATMRTVVLDASGARVGMSALAIGLVRRGPWIGPTDGGARVVLVADDRWVILAPCGDRHAGAP